MKNATKNSCTGLVCLLMGGAVFAADQPATSLSPAAAPATNVLGPKIQFETTVHDFGRAMSGEQVKYIYTFKNVGDQTLEVSGVQACGCLTTDFTRKTEPGMTGSVPVSFNSSAYGGPVFKAITVTSNDKSNPRAQLQFKGTVWKALEVIPPFAVFNQLNVESPPATITVRIVNNLDEQVTLSEPVSQNPAFAAEVKTVKPGKEFQVVVSTVPPLTQGSVNGKITIKTTSSKSPEITINALANGVQPVVSVNPSQLLLPGAPLATQQTRSVDIVNHGPNTLSLSEPTVNMPGVDVQLKEMTPGHLYAAMLTFPQGFAIPQGEHIELSVKSSLASAPVIKVPIIQNSAHTAPLVMPIKPRASDAIHVPAQAASH